MSHGVPAGRSGKRKYQQCPHRYAADALGLRYWPSRLQEAVLAQGPRGHYSLLKSPSVSKAGNRLHGGALPRRGQCAQRRDGPVDSRTRRVPGHSPLRDLLNAGVACRTTSPAARPMAPLVALVLDHLGITLERHRCCRLLAQPDLLRRRRTVDPARQNLRG